MKQFWDIELDTEPFKPMKRQYRSNMSSNYIEVVDGNSIIWKQVEIETPLQLVEHFTSLTNKMDDVNRKLFYEHLFKGIMDNSPELFALLSDIYDISSGTLESFIANDRDYKRELSKHPKIIHKYQDGKFTPRTDRSVRRDPSYNIIDFFMSQYKLSMADARLVAKAFGLIKEKNSDGSRYSKECSGSYMKLNQSIREQFFSEQTIEDWNVKVIGYVAKDSSSMSTKVMTYLVGLEGKNSILRYKKVPNDYMRISIRDIGSMSTYSQIIILRNMEAVIDLDVIVKLHHQQEIGNYGRRYNVLNEIAREDRKHISNLFGLDMETALQAIVLQDTGLDLPFTKELVSNKRKARKAVMDLMGYKTIDEAKMEITAIYQGRRYKSSYEPLKHIFEERDLIAKTIIEDKRNSNRIKYATARADEKLQDKRLKVSKYSNPKATDRDRAEILKKYMFFYWTYAEREIQEVIAEKLNKPITLHDAVYTQDKTEIKAVDIATLEQEIEYRTGYKITLEKQ